MELQKSQHFANFGKGRVLSQDEEAKVIHGICLIIADSSMHLSCNSTTKVRKVSWGVMES
jgi:hypothetical protein